MTSFRFNPRPTTWVTVRLTVPTADGLQTQTFRAQFLILPAKERQALASDPRAALAKIWLGWEDIVDAEGTPVPFSETARDQLMDYDYVTFGVAAAYERATAGIETKN